MMGLNDYDARRRACDVLDIPRGAISRSMVSRSFRRLSAKVHPDRNNLNGSHEAWDELVRARDYLLKTLSIPETNERSNLTFSGGSLLFGNRTATKK